MAFHPSSFAVIVWSCVLVGCAAPRAVGVLEPKASAPEKPEIVTLAAAPKPVPDDGFRTGNLLELPKETEYRPTNPSLPKSNSSAGTVIVNPPNPPKTKLQAEGATGN